MSESHFIIVTPSYNQAQFIEQTIASVLDQEKVRVHYLVMDGGSTDGTVALLENHNRSVSFLSKKDNGQADAINRGIESLLSKHPDLDPEHTYIGYLNSDDYYLPNGLSSVAQAFEQRPNKQWVVGDCQIVNEQGREIQSYVRWYKKIWRAVYSSTVLNLLNLIPQPATFMRLSTWLIIGRFDEALRYTMDYDYWLRIQAKYGSPHMLDTPIAAFRIHGQSKGGSSYTAQFAEELEVVQRYSKNPLVNLLHRLHTMAITVSYSLLKG